MVSFCSARQRGGPLLDRFHGYSCLLQRLDELLIVNITTGGKSLWVGNDKNAATF